MNIPWVAFGTRTVNRSVRAFAAALSLGVHSLAVTSPEQVTAASSEEPARAARTEVPNPVPTGVVVRALSATSMSVTWNSVNGHRHAIARSTNGGPEVLAGYGAFGTFTDEGLLPGISYTYRVSSLVDYPEGTASSPPSEPASATTATLAGVDIGNVGAAGSFVRNGQVLSVAGGGADIWGSADEFRYEHISWTGDIVLRVRVLDVQRTHFWAKAGLMIRENLTGGSRYVMVFTNPNGDGNFQTRSAPGGATSIAGRDLTFAPSWLKLTRSGSTFRAYQSRDGSSWTEIGSATLDLPSTVYVGLAVTSHQRGTLCHATFDNFSISSTWDPAGPAVPANVTAVATAWNQVRINWTDTSSNEAGFVIEQSMDNINFASVGGANVDGTTATIGSLTASTTYHYRVRSLASLSTRASAGVSNVVTVTTQPPPADAPSPPSGLTATAVSAYRIDLNWTDNSTTEASFTIERSSDGVNFFQWNSVAANTTQFSDRNLQPSTRYHYRVRARATDGYMSAPSGSVSATTQPPPLPPAAPSSATAATLSLRSVQVSWVDHSNDETEFAIEMSTDGTNFYYGIAAPANQTTATLTHLTPSTTYYFRVRAMNGSVASSPSNVVTATTQPPPSAPTHLTATAVSSNRVDLRWTDSAANATHYQIWRHIADQGTSMTLVSTVTGDRREHADLTVSGATTYRYNVRALHNDWPSEYSAPAVVTTPPVTATNWESRDIGAVAAAGGESESDGTLTLRGAGDDIWNHTDEFRYRYQSWSGDGTFIARVTSLTHTHGWAKAGIMLRESLEPGARHVYVCANPNNYGGLIWRATANGASQFMGAVYEISQMWLKLVRTGNSFQAFQSADGANWIAIGSTIDLALPSNVWAGLAVTSHVDGVLCTATFSNVSFTGATPPPSTLPGAPTNLAASAVSANGATLTWIDNANNETGFEVERSTDNASFTRLATTSAGATSYQATGLNPSTPYFFRIRAINSAGASSYSNVVSVTTSSAPPPTWAFGDIGAVGVAGSNESSGSTITVRGSGADIWGTADAFRFVYRTMDGDCLVEACIESLGNTHPWAKAGVMIRESLAPGARNVFLYLTPAQGIGLQTRATTGGETTFQPGPAATARYWVRLRRTGNTITASVSANGSIWSSAGTVELPLGASVQAGFAVTSHNNSVLNTAVFSDPFIQ